jgi:hypothetical protein
VTKRFVARHEDLLGSDWVERFIDGRIPVGGELDNRTFGNVRLDC